MKKKIKLTEKLLVKTVFNKIKPGKEFFLPDSSLGIMKMVKTNSYYVEHMKRNAVHVKDGYLWSLSEDDVVYVYKLNKVSEEEIFSHLEEKDDDYKGH